MYSLKTNEKLIVFQLHAIILMGHPPLNEELKKQLIDAYFMIL